MGGVRGGGRSKEELKQHTAPPNKNTTRHRCLTGCRRYRRSSSTTTTTIRGTMDPVPRGGWCTVVWCGVVLYCGVLLYCGVVWYGVVVWCEVV